jgi:hypothetical protein
MVEGPADALRSSDQYVLALGFDVSGELSILDQEYELELAQIMPALGASPSRRDESVSTRNPSDSFHHPRFLHSGILSAGSLDVDDKLDSLKETCENFLTDKERSATVFLEDFAGTIEIQARLRNESPRSTPHDLSVSTLGIVYFKGYEDAENTIGQESTGSTSRETRTPAPRGESEDGLQSTARTLDRVAVYSLVLTLQSKDNDRSVPLSNFDLKTARVLIETLPDAVASPRVEFSAGWKDFLTSDRQGQADSINLYDFLAALAWYRVARPVRQLFLDQYRALPEQRRDEGKLQGYRREYFRPDRFATVVRDLRDSISLDAWVLTSAGARPNATEWMHEEHPPNEKSVSRFLGSIGRDFRFVRAHVHDPDLLLDRTLISIPATAQSELTNFEGRRQEDWLRAQLGLTILLATFIVFEADLFTLSSSRAENLAYQLFKIRRHGVILYSEAEERLALQADKAKELHVLERESMYLFSEFEDRFRFSSFRVQDELDSMRVWLGVKILYASLEKRLATLVRFQEIAAEADEKRRDQQRNQMILLLSVTLSVLAAFEPLTTIFSGQKEVISVGLLVALVVVWATVIAMLLPNVLGDRRLRSESIRESSRSGDDTRSNS